MLIICVSIILTSFVVRSILVKRNSFTLGVVSNFKGKNSQIGVESFNAITLAYEQYRGKNPRGVNVKILPVDESWEPEKMKAAYLSCADKVDLLVILSGSTNVLTVKDEIASRPQLVHALVGVTSTEFSAQQDNIVRNVADLDQEQRQIAKFAQNHLKIGKILLLVENEYNSGYTAPASKFFASHSKGMEVEMVDYLGNIMGTSAAMDMLRKNTYDMVYIISGGLPRETGILIQHIRAIKPDMPVMITPWVRGMIFLQALGSYDSNIYMSSHVKFSDNPHYDAFLTDYMRRFGQQTQEYFVPIMYDFSVSLFDTLHRVRSSKAKTFIPQLISSEYRGTVGVTRFDEFGDAKTELSFYRLVDGEWRYEYP